MNTELIAFIEELAANAWPAEINQCLDGWRLRATGGASRRVNSVWPNLDGSHLDLDQRLTMAEDFYHRRGLPARFQMCPAAHPPNLAEVLVNRDYQESAHTTVQTARAETVLAGTAAPNGELTCDPELNEPWFQTYIRAAGYPAERASIRRGILSRIGPAACFALSSEDGEPVGTGLGVYERGWLGIFCMVTDSQHRRRGVASRVLHTLAQWGQAQGASHIYLQVMDENLPAIALYGKVGFEMCYRYYYLTQP